MFDELSQETCEDHGGHDEKEQNVAPLLAMMNRMTSTRPFTQCQIS